MTETPAGVEGAKARAAESAPGSDPLARAVFALLVLACFAAFLITQRLKHTPTVVQDFDMTPFFSPYPTGHLKQAKISFKLEHAERVSVTIIDSSGNTVATLVHGQPVARYKQFSLVWNGRRGGARIDAITHSPRGLEIIEPLIEGATAPAGEYRVRVALAHHGPVLSPRSITLVGP